MKVNKFTSWARNGGKTVLINSRNQKCIILDDTGNEIWVNFIKTLSVAQTIRNLKLKYASSDKRLIERDIIRMYRLLLKYQIIEE